MGLAKPHPLDQPADGLGLIPFGLEGRD